VSDVPLRIVIAEDDEDLAAVVRDLLERDGRFVVDAVAGSGDEAVRFVEEHDPDLVLMDIGMPRLDGIEATRAILARDSSQHVVIYTGSDEYDDVARADAAGAAGYLHKSALTSPDLADALTVLHTNWLNGLPDP
jgi:DNA-binding NarL/FixJ family response regulator